MTLERMPSLTNEDFVAMLEKAYEHVGDAPEASVGIGILLAAHNDMVEKFNALVHYVEVCCGE